MSRGLSEVPILLWNFQDVKIQLCAEFASIATLQQGIEGSYFYYKIYLNLD